MCWVAGLKCVSNAGFQDPPFSCSCCSTSRDWRWSPLWVAWVLLILLPWAWPIPLWPSLGSTSWYARGSPPKTDSEKREIAGKNLRDFSSICVSFFFADRTVKRTRDFVWTSVWSKAVPSAGNLLATSHIRPPCGGNTHLLGRLLHGTHPDCLRWRPSHCKQCTALWPMPTALHPGFCSHDALCQVLSIAADCGSSDVVCGCGLFVAIPSLPSPHHQTQLGLQRWCCGHERVYHSRYRYPCNHPEILTQVQEELHLLVTWSTARFARVLQAGCTFCFDDVVGSLILPLLLACYVGFLAYHEGR